MHRVQLLDCRVEDYVEESALVFKCFRLMGIPQPSLQTVDKQVYRKYFTVLYIADKAMTKYSFYM